MHFGEGVDASCASDEDLAVILRIEVDKAFMPEHTVLQFHSTGETGLFIDGEEALDSRMLQLRIRDSSKRHRDSDTVISTKGGSFGFEPLAIHIGLYRIGHKIMLHIAVLLAHHVHVGLKDDSFMVLITGRSRHTHDHVHSLIGDTLYAM